MITPLDIKKHEFATKWMGYDKDEVRALLETVAKDFEDMVRQNTQLSERIKVVEERLNHYRLMEKTLQDAVLTMQTTLEEKRRVAEQEAELLIQQARQKADDELVDARTHLSDLRNELYQLDNQKRSFYVRTKNMLRSQMDLLDAMVEAEESRDEVFPGPGDFPEPQSHMARPNSIPHGDSFVRGIERS